MSYFLANSGFRVAMTAVAMTKTKEEIYYEKRQLLSSSALLMLTKNCSSMMLTLALNSPNILSNSCLFLRIIDCSLDPRFSHVSIDI